MEKASILVITVGGSVEPIVASLRHHNPGEIYFIPSEGTKGSIESIIQEAYGDRCHAKRYTFVVGDPNDLVSCFNTCQQAIDDIRKGGAAHENIVVDPTGGTKLMSAALLLAATELGLKVCYVGGERRNKGGLGTVESGSEKIFHSAHPYDVIARSEKQRFCLYFNSYRFQSAIDVCDQIINKASDKAGAILKALRKITTGYRDWDFFNHSTARHHLRSGLERLRQLSETSPEDINLLREFMQAVDENILRLDKILQATSKEEISLPLVEDLLANACRRAEQGLYDDAVARLYRALEMIGQWRFVKHFNHSTTAFPCDRLGNLSKQLQDEYCGDRKEKCNIGCRASFEILNAIGDEYGKLFVSNSKSILRPILDRRNSSILAHGTQPMKETDFDRNYKAIKDIFGIDGESTQFARLDPHVAIALGVR